MFCNHACPWQRPGDVEIHSANCREQQVKGGNVQQNAAKCVNKIRKLQVDVDEIDCANALKTGNIWFVCLALWIAQH